MVNQPTHAHSPPALQPGTVKALYNSQRSNPLFQQPLLQITALGRLQAPDNEKHRYKANLSDGQHYMKAVFSSELSASFDSGAIQRLHLIRLGTFMVRPKEANNYLYIQTIDSIEPCTYEIGTPVSIATGKPSLDPSLGALDENSNNGLNKPFPTPAVTPAPAPAKRPSMDTTASKRTNAQPGTATPVDIKDLTPFSNKWIIRGRVTAKSDLKSFTSAKGDGKIFSFDLTDSTAQVKVVAFSQCAEIFFPLVEPNETYTLTNATVRMANKRYATSAFDYEIQLEKHSELKHVHDESLPKYRFQFTKLKDLVPGGALVDVVAVAKEVFPAGTITVKSTGRELAKRDVIVLDETGSARLTLWGARAAEEYAPGTVLCLKGLKVGEYNGPTLSTLSASQVCGGEDVPEALQLQRWFLEVGKDVAVERGKPAAGAGPRTLVAAALGWTPGQKEYLTVCAQLMFLRMDALFYTSCPGENCNKKVVREGNGGYRCEKCNYVYESCNYRYMVSAHVGDFTGQLWVTLFNESAEMLFGVTAEELNAMDEEGQEKTALVKGKLGGEFVMRLRVREDTYGGEARLRYTCVEAVPVDYTKEAQRLLSLIEQ